MKSDRPQYWKAETLDGFDGFRWIRTNDLNDTLYGTQVAYTEPRIEGKWDYGEYNLDWDKRIRVTVRSLSTPFVIGAGVILRVDGVTRAAMDDGTTRLIGSDRLEKGDTYSVRAYAPNPTRKQMQGSPKGYSANLARYTAITLPHPGESVIDELAGRHASRSARAPCRRASRSSSRFATATRPTGGRAPTGCCAARPTRRCTRGRSSSPRDAPTSYDAVKNVELWLQNNFTYSEHVPTHDVPLMGFLEQDKRGYCQQFSGTMALMLRMAGIPARVAAGFSPGSLQQGHARVPRARPRRPLLGRGVVHRDRLGAVRPDAGALAGAVAVERAGHERGRRRRRRGAALTPGRGGLGPGTDPSGHRAGARATATGSCPPCSCSSWPCRSRLARVMIGLRVARLRLLSPDEVAEVQLSELRRALVRLGWELPESTTLLGLERRLGRLAGPSSKAYAGALRAHRYDPRAPAGPHLQERRAVRRELSRGGSSSACADWSRYRRSAPD